jgi:hypothetical protein
MEPQVGKLANIAAYAVGQSPIIPREGQRSGPNGGK